MDSPTIDDTQTRAICEEIGERLQILLKPAAAGEKPGFADKLDQLFSQPNEGGDGS